MRDSAEWRLGRPGRRALELLAFLIGSQVPALARLDLPPELDLVPPFLTSVNAEDLLPIDVGADGLTELVAVGGGFLDGDELLPSTFDSWSDLHILEQRRSGGWSVLQSFGRGVAGSHRAVGDLDGDGLEDIVTLGRWNQQVQICHLRQTRDRSFTIQAIVPVDMETFPEGMEIVPGDPAGLLLWRAGLRGSPTQTVEGTLFRIEPSGGPVETWRGTLLSLSEPFFRDEPLFAPSDSALWMLYPVRPDIPNRAVYAVCSITAASPSPPREVSLLDPSRFGRLFQVRAGGQVETWAVPTGPLSPVLLRLAFPPPGGLPEFHTIPVRGLPEGSQWSLSYGTIPPTLAAPDGRVSILLKARQAAVERSILLEVDPDRTLARPAASFPLSPYSRPKQIVRDPSGALRVLLQGQDVWHLVEPTVDRPDPADVPLPIRRLLAWSDLNEDGIEDPVVEVSAGGSNPAVAVLHSLGRPPWFSEPILLSAARSRIHRIEAVYPGEIDGDGRIDLLFDVRALLEDHSSYWLSVPFFNVATTLRPAWDEAHRADWRPRALIDLDADGRLDLCIDQDKDTMMVVSWGEDRNLQPPRMVQNMSRNREILQIADIDRDGRAEWIGKSGSTIVIERLDLEANQVTRLAQFWGGGRRHGYDVQAIDIDGDGPLELLVQSDRGVSIYRIEGEEFRATPIGWISPHIPYGRTALQRVDLDGNGKAGIFMDRMGSFSPTGLLQDLLGTPEGRILVPAAWIHDPNGRPPLSLRFADLDHDGDEDLLLVSEDGIRIRWNPEARSSSGPRAYPLAIRWTGGHPGPSPPEVVLRALSAGPARIGLYNLPGRRIWESDLDLPAGVWTTFDLSGANGPGRLASGVYFLRVEAGGDAATRRLVIVR